MSERLKFGISLELEYAAFTGEQLAVIRAVLHSWCAGITWQEAKDWMTFVNIERVLESLRSGDGR